MKRFKELGILFLVAVISASLCFMGERALSVTGITGPLTTVVQLSDSQDGKIVGDRMTVLFDEVSGTDNGFRLEQACIEHNIKYLDLVLINPGGNVFLMFDYLETIDRLKARGVFVTTYARGIIASAAVPIFVSGAKRIITSHTIVMLHPGTWRDQRLGGWPEVYDNLFWKFEQWYSRFISDRTNIPYKAILSIMQRDDTNHGAIYWTADVALALGIATEIQEFGGWYNAEPEDETQVDYDNPRPHAKAPQS